MAGFVTARSSTQPGKKKDLMVLDKTQTHVVGCYPMTMEETPYRIRIGEYCFCAMCALDAERWYF